MTLIITPVTFAQACAFIDHFHRHHKHPQGWKFGCGVKQDDRLVGVVVVGRPVARVLDDGLTLEVTRLCTDGTPHAASMLYATVWKAAKALGYQRLITYTLDSEPGTSLRAAGFVKLADIRQRNWNCPSRPRSPHAVPNKRQLWQLPAPPAPNTTAILEQPITKPL